MILQGSDERLQILIHKICYDASMNLHIIEQRSSSILSSLVTGLSSINFRKQRLAISMDDGTYAGLSDTVSTTCTIFITMISACVCMYT